MTDADDPRAEAAADIRDDAPRADPSDHSPLAFPAHLLPVEPDDDTEVILEEVIPAPDDGKALRPRREARETALVLLLGVNWLQFGTRTFGTVDPLSRDPEPPDIHSLQGFANHLSALAFGNES